MCQEFLKPPAFVAVKPFPRVQDPLLLYAKVRKEVKSLPLISSTQASRSVYMGKSNCERVSPAMLHARGGRRFVKDETTVNFDFSGGLIGGPWIDEGGDDGSSCCDVTRKVRGLLGRVAESAATTADCLGDFKLETVVGSP